MTTLAAGFVLGLAGSVHCLAMCGPLTGVMAPALGRRGAAAIWYHAGRLLVYVLIGIAAGLAGHAVIAGGLGRALAVSAGAVMVLTAVGQIRAPRITAGRWIAARLARVLEHIARIRSRHPRGAALGAGAVNGLLPCGLVYAAALAAAATGNAASAAQLMLAFGVGTLPAMMMVWFSSTLVPVAARRRLRLVTPVAVALVGLLLIGRGLGDTFSSGALGASGSSGALGSKSLHSH